jgi:glycerophosphoryl diester phosphodiesterase
VAIDRTEQTAARAQPRNPLIIAHRGGSPNDVDNSAAAFQHAMQVGVDMLECDLRVTGDRRLVLMHDAVAMVEGRRLVVQDTRYDELREAFSWLMTLDEFLEHFGRLLPFNLDLKTHGYETEALETVRRHGAVDHTLISTVHTLSVALLARKQAASATKVRLALSRGHLNSSLRIGVISFWLRAVLSLTLPALLGATGARATMLQQGVIDRWLVERLHARGYSVFTWTIDDEQDAFRVRAAGVDGMASNDPARIIAALESIQAR